MIIDLLEAITALKEAQEHGLNQIQMHAMQIEYAARIIKDALKVLEIGLDANEKVLLAMLTANTQALRAVQKKDEENNDGRKSDHGEDGRPIAPPDSSDSDEH